MTKQKLTINEVIRFSNHDFLNQLHLIGMNLDLGRVDDAKAIIEQVSEQCQLLSHLNKIGIQQTIEWLQTLKWRYSALQVTVTCNVMEALNEQFDLAIVQYLENTIIHVYDRLDAFTEQRLQIEIEGAANAFNIMFHLQGKWDAPHFDKEIEGLHIETIENTNVSWKYVIRNKE
ncbi:Spo0B domain-containing protein [Lysinibacillus sp. 54212]|uniref:Spo0B domain-containing protein n=1 Tax=Lysinibacillus sp. 54212 TaxID=3119829 RepID=UPI002FCBEB6F